ncbi:Non-specific serine/threonine protein kinase [Blyttiomyces sp. JEL0837]|nr:Non-specific serine/threonine protein kinase [Blyttiomyces sp. JEL0837]
MAKRRRTPEEIEKASMGCFPCFNFNGLLGGFKRTGPTPHSEGDKLKSSILSPDDEVALKKLGRAALIKVVLQQKTETKNLRASLDHEKVRCSENENKAKDRTKQLEAVKGELERTKTEVGVATSETERVSQIVESQKAQEALNETLKYHIETLQSQILDAKNKHSSANRYQAGVGSSSQLLPNHVSERTMEEPTEETPAQDQETVTSNSDSIADDSTDCNEMEAPTIMTENTNTSTNTSQSNVDVISAAADQTQLRVSANIGHELQLSRKLDIFNYEIGDKIGHGGFADVFEVRLSRSDPTAPWPFALKLLREAFNVRPRRGFHNEVYIFEKLRQGTDSTFLLGYYGWVEHGNTVGVLMDKAVGGDLSGLVELGKGVGSEKVICFYVAEVLVALLKMHDLGVMYLDLKSSNVLLDSEGHILLSDFGVSAVIGEDRRFAHGYTPQYAAPETLTTGKQIPAFDFWSLGVLMYFLLTGYLPFGMSNRPMHLTQVYAAICGTLTFPESVSMEAQEVVRGLLQYAPEDRMKFVNMEMKRCLFFKDIDWERLARREVAPPPLPVGSDTPDVGSDEI